MAIPRTTGSDVVSFLTLDSYTAVRFCGGMRTRRTALVSSFAFTVMVMLTGSV